MANIDLPTSAPGAPQKYSSTVYNRAWREKRFLAGVCSACRSPRLPDGKLCAARADKNRKRARKESKGLFKWTSPEVKAECRRLRREERLGLVAIGKRFGIAKSTVWTIVKDIPLTAAEVREALLDAGRRGCAKLSTTAQSKLGSESPYFSIIKDKVKSTDQKGAIAEAAAVFRMKVWGIVPHMPMCAGGKSDIAVFIPETGRLLRVQVKCARRSKWGMPRASLRSRANGKFGIMPIRLTHTATKTH